VRRANLSRNLALGLTFIYPETPIRGRHWKDFASNISISVPSRPASDLIQAR
jgi:hypothetical protein